MTETLAGLANVHNQTAHELVGTLRDLAAAATDPRTTRQERVARFGHAGGRLRDTLAAVALLDPYTDPQYSRVQDLMVRSSNGNERLALSAQHDQLRGLLAIETRDADLGGAIGKGVHAGPPTSAANAAHWLNSFATPVPVTPGVVDQIPLEWSEIPQASIDGTDPAAASPTIDGAPAPFHSSTAVVNPSLPLGSWSGTAPREIEALVLTSVDHTLEAYLLGQLTAAVPTAATLEAAEIAVGTAWPGGADLLLVNGADKAKVVRAYASAGLHPEDRPTILATAGVTAPGTAVMLAQAAVLLELTAPEWITVPDPKHLGIAVGAVRYGRTQLRYSGAVQKVTIA